MVVFLLFFKIYVSHYHSDDGYDDDLFKMIHSAKLNEEICK